MPPAIRRAPWRNTAAICGAILRADHHVVRLSDVGWCYCYVYRGQTHHGTSASSDPSPHTGNSIPAAMRNRHAKLVARLAEYQPPFSAIQRGEHLFPGAFVITASECVQLSGFADFKHSPVATGTLALTTPHRRGHARPIASADGGRLIDRPRHALSMA